MVDRTIKYILAEDTRYGRCFFDEATVGKMGRITTKFLVGGGGLSRGWMGSSATGWYIWTSPDRWTRAIGVLLILA